MKVKLKKGEKLSSNNNYCNLPYNKWVMLNQGKSVELEVLPKLVIPSDIRPSKTGNYQKIIYWGDIAGRTKSFIEFRSSIEQLRKKRTDFKVWVPLLKDNNQFLKNDWVINNNSINNNNNLYSASIHP